MILTKDSARKPENVQVWHGSLLFLVNASDVCILYKRRDSNQVHQVTHAEQAERTQVHDAVRRPPQVEVMDAEHTQTHGQYVRERHGALLGVVELT